MTRNSYMYAKIKRLFGDILEQCFKKGHEESEKVELKGEESLLGVLEGEFGDRNLFLRLHRQLEN